MSGLLSWRGGKSGRRAPMTTRNDGLLRRDHPKDRRSQRKKNRENGTCMKGTKSPRIDKQNKSRFIFKEKGFFEVNGEKIKRHRLVRRKKKLKKARQDVRISGSRGVLL